MEKGPLHKILKQLLALSYLPRKHIFYAFEGLRKQGQNNERVIELFNYVEATWFKSNVWGTGNWSNFKRLVQTNNDCDGWHRHLNSRAGKENLGLYTLLPLIYHEAEMVNLNYRFVLEHNLTSDKRKGSKFCQKKLYELWTKYESEDITTFEFLNSCIQFVPFWNLCIYVNNCKTFYVFYWN